MKTAVLACNTIRAELILAESRVKSGHDLYWVESNLHNNPDRLRVEIQRSLDTLDSYERVILAFGFCGNSVAGIKTRSFELIMPFIDDCVSLMIGSIAERARLTAGHNSIYLTKGWLGNETNILSEYEYTVKKYDEDRANLVIKMMYAQYDWLSLIDTGAYELDSIAEAADKISERFGLERVVIPGTTSYIEQLLVGPYDEGKFLRIEPHSAIDESMLVLF